MIKYPSGPGENRSSRRPTKATPVVAQLVSCYGRASTDSCKRTRAARSFIKYRLGTCHYPRVHGVTVVVNSIFSGWRFDDAGLD